MVLHSGVVKVITQYIGSKKKKKYHLKRLLPILTIERNYLLLKIFCNITFYVICGLLNDFPIKNIALFYNMCYITYI